MLFQKIRSARRGFSFPIWSVPITLLILVVLSYGLRVFRLGFFWDDWPYLWFFERFGPDGIIRAFSGDRPFLSFIYISSLTVFGHSIQGWQIFALFARWLCSVGLWWALALAWPRQAGKAAWAAILFTVYPGFSQHWISVIYGQAFFLFAALFFSIAITLWLARRRPGRAILTAGTLLALALSGFTMFSTEYFFGLELLRPALLWLVLADYQTGAEHPPQNRWRWYRQQATKVLAWWAPYLALMAIFIFWRGFIHVFAGYQMRTLQEMGESPLITVWNLLVTILKDLIVSTLAAWGQTLQLGGLFDAGIWPGLRLLGLMALTGLLAGVFLNRLAAGDGERNPELFRADPGPMAPQPSSGGIFDCWSVQAMLIGLLAVLVAGWPFWITQLPLRLEFPQDRFSLPLAVGVSLLLAGLVDALGKDLPRKALIIAGMAALATGFHFTTSEAYRQDWNQARDFFWQLTWRAPSIAPGTLLLTSDLPFAYFEDDSLTAPLNWTYDPDGHSTRMNYILYDYDVRYHNLPAFNKENAIEKSFRATQFSGSTTRVILFHYEAPGCVRVLDPVYDADLYNLPETLLSKLSISKPGALIQDQATPAVPPEDIFGSEPKRRWCYFFEKADLARQNGDWEAIISLSRQSIGAGIRPEDPAEYLPFIEGFSRAKYWDDAMEMTRTTYIEAPKLRPALCAVWRRAAADLSEQEREAAAQVFSNANRLLNCPTP